MPQTSVEIHQAFLWTCDDCGRDNFERAITVSPETIEEWVEGIGEGAWLRAPDRVTCSHCGTNFETTYDSPQDQPCDD